MRFAAILVVVLGAWAATAPAADPSGTRYSVRMAESPQEADLTPLRDRIKDVAKMPAKVHAMGDSGATARLYVLTAGEFATREEALAARVELATKLGLAPGEFQVIELPR